MSAAKRICRHGDIRLFDGFRCCLACGEAIFEPVGDRGDTTTQETNRSHKFKPLNHELGQEIRLLVLNAGDPSDSLTCEIINVNLEDNPIYEALSYTWADQNGDTTLSQEIVCASNKTVISITKNCESALRALRQKGRRRPLWVDAICINQSDLSERNHQIGFMGKIYSEASQVLIYLGPETFSTKAVIEWLDSMTSRSNLDLESVRHFLNTRYFDRVWVLQEIALAKLITLVAGDKQIRWTAETIRMLQEPFPHDALKIPSALEWHPGTELEHDFLKVLHKSRHCSATDPRDKVYALLGLATEEAVEGLPTNYSFNVDQVYISVARHFIERKRRLDILKHRADNQRSGYMDSFPSWVPRWGPKLSYSPLPEQFTEQHRQMFATKWFRPPTTGNEKDLEDLEKVYNLAFANDSTDSSLVVSTADWCAWLSSPVHPRHKAKEDQSTVDAFTLALYTSYKRDCDFQYTIEESLARTLSIKWYSHTLPSSKPPYILRVRAHYLASVILGRGGSYEHDNNESIPRCSKCTTHDNFYERPQECQQSWQPRKSERPVDMERAMATQAFVDHFETNRSVGFLASGESVELGDTVWALPDVDVPFVLRQVEQHYELVGQCYLHVPLSNLFCGCCGEDLGTNGIVTQIIDIW